MSKPIPEKIQKQTYSDVLDRLGYFCQTCGEEQQNANGLIRFKSTETVQDLMVCHNCLPEGFE